MLDIFIWWVWETWVWWVDGQVGSEWGGKTWFKGLLCTAHKNNKNSFTRTHAHISMLVTSNNNKIITFLSSFINFLIFFYKMDSLVGQQLMRKCGEVVKADKVLEDKKIICFYFSSHWCPPCKEFTPILADFYSVRIFTTYFAHQNHSTVTFGDSWSNIVLTLSIQCQFFLKQINSIIFSEIVLNWIDNR